jgi:hypothetical protein
MSSPSGGTPSAVMPTAPKAGDVEHDAVRCGGPLGPDAACASGVSMAEGMSARQHCHLLGGVLLGT